MDTTAELLENWQQQLEEVTALCAICGDDFTVLAEGFAAGQDAASPSEELAAQPPSEPLECQAAVHVEVPQRGLALQVSTRRKTAASSDSCGTHFIRVTSVPHRLVTLDSRCPEPKLGCCNCRWTRVTLVLAQQKTAQTTHELWACGSGICRRCA
jgi:hypothetical protein